MKGLVIEILKSFDDDFGIFKNLEVAIKIVLEYFGKGLAEITPKVLLILKNVSYDCVHLVVLRRNVSRDNPFSLPI